MAHSLAQIVIFTMIVRIQLIGSCGFGEHKSYLTRQPKVSPPRYLYAASPVETLPGSPRSLDPFIQTPEAAIPGMEAVFESMQHRLDSANAMIREKDAALRQKETRIWRLINENNQEMRVRDARIHQQDLLLQGKHIEIQAKDTEILADKATIRAQDVAIDAKDSVIASQKINIAALKQSLVPYERMLSSAQQFHQGESRERSPVPAVRFNSQGHRGGSPGVGVKGGLKATEGGPVCITLYQQ